MWSIQRDLTALGSLATEIRVSKSASFLSSLWQHATGRESVVKLQHIYTDLSKKFAMLQDLTAQPPPGSKLTEAQPEQSVAATLTSGALGTSVSSTSPDRKRFFKRSDCNIRHLSTTGPSAGSILDVPFTPVDLEEADAIRAMTGFTPAPVFGLASLDVSVESLHRVISASLRSVSLRASLSKTASATLRSVQKSCASDTEYLEILGHGMNNVVLGVSLRPYANLPVALKLFKDAATILADPDVHRRIIHESAIQYSLRGCHGIVRMYGLICDTNEVILGQLLERCDASLDKRIYDLSTNLSLSDKLHVLLEAC